MNKITPNDNMQHIPRYSLPICNIIGSDVCEFIYACTPNNPNNKNTTYVQIPINIALPAT